MKKQAPPRRGNPAPKPKHPERCPVCGSEDIKHNRPTKGDNECRTCGHVHNNSGRVIGRMV